MRIDAALALISLSLVPLAGPAPAQEPLSAIDWLRRNPPQVPLAALPPTYFAPSPGTEPPVTDGVSAPEIVVTPLEDTPVAVGLVPNTVTGLPPTLWQGSATPVLARLVADAPVSQSPAMQSVLYTLMLAEAQPPADSGKVPGLTLAMLDRLMDLGAVEPAEALARRAGPARSPELFHRWFDATLLTGTEDAACATLAVNPHLAPDYAARVYCSARRGDWPAAALMLDTAIALGDLPEARGTLLELFLHGDLDGGLLPPPSLPVSVDPLDFRLYEAIGEPLPAQGLPRAFSHADLRDVAGWKAQLEAAERLARTGALSANRFLGIYTAREPAASGGIWDRVQAVQRFETALNTGSGEAIGKTLRPAWDAMRAAGTEVTFATLFADRLAATPPSSPAAQALAWRIRMLSDSYERAARDAPEGSEAAFLAGIARGRPEAGAGAGDVERAIAEGFSDAAELPRQLRDLLDRGALGEMILRAIALYKQGTDGNPDALTDALAAFRSVGLEDTARRAALQLMLLEPRHR
ncbi:hypothetical protein [Marinibacterium profundimaris]|uniref:Antifreeze glycopeptide polyprotein n=1 Tax=Marinibacterium profundimaris TaxID=1679460 RepID=A0A225NRK2_9RHOB|nr:hypothetical protein [Marinibacterium profundimaris]OWU77485.1 hypothetical protein ATO3_01925 [Marinibacterium profundimaris]